jgi:hypothetical protein
VEKALLEYSSKEGRKEEIKKGRRRGQRKKGNIYG